MTNITINNSTISGINNFDNNSNIIINNTKVSNKLTLKEVLQQVDNRRIKKIGYIGEINHIAESWIFECFTETWNKIIKEIPSFNFEFQLGDIENQTNIKQIFPIENRISKNYTLENFKIGKTHGDIWNEYIKSDLMVFFYNTLIKEVLYEDFKFNTNPENSLKQCKFVVEIMELNHNKDFKELFSPDGVIFLRLNIRSEVR